MSIFIQHSRNLRSRPKKILLKLTEDKSALYHVPSKPLKGQKKNIKV